MMVHVASESFSLANACLHPRVIKLQSYMRLALSCYASYLFSDYLFAQGIAEAEVDGLYDNVVKVITAHWVSYTRH